MLATCWATFGAIYMSYGGCLTAFGAVCWQPAGPLLVQFTCLMGVA